MWGLSFSSSLASLGAPNPFLSLSSPLLFLSCFILSSIIHPLGHVRMVRGFRENQGGRGIFKFFLKVCFTFNLFCICVCFFVCRRLNTLNKCALMRLEISPQRKRVSLSAHAHTWIPLLYEKPLCTSPQPQLRFLTSTISSLLATGQSCVFSHLI